MTDTSDHPTNETEKWPRRTIKGLRLPLKDLDRETELQAARSSLYFWWWSFLRESVDYRRAVSGRKEEPWAGMARDFGILGDKFDPWWFESGRALFEEKVAIPKVRKLEHGEPANYEGINPKLVIELPLTIRRATVLKQINKLLDGLDGPDGRHFSALRVHAFSTARRRIYPNQRIRISSFKPLLDVWQARKKLPSMPWWQIGETLGLSPVYKTRPDDDDATVRYNHRLMSLIVQRHYRRATALIEFAARGDFPRFK